MEEVIVTFSIIIFAVFCLLIIIYLLRLFNWESRLDNEAVIITLFWFIPIKKIPINEIVSIGIGTSIMSSILSDRYINRWQVPIYIETKSSYKCLITPKNMNYFISYILKKQNISIKYDNYFILLKIRLIGFGIFCLLIAFMSVFRNQWFLDLSLLFKTLLMLCLIFTNSAMIVFLYYGLKKFCLRNSACIFTEIATRT